MSRTFTACSTAVALVALTLTSAVAVTEENTGPKAVQIKAFECTTSPCNVTVYDANGRPVGKKQVPMVGPNGLKGERYGPAFIRIMLDGQEAYVSRMDVRLDKHLIAPNPGVVPCRPQIGTMGSGC